MTKLELLNVFLNDRLTAAAEEIFRAVKDTVLEYQSEILRSKEENQRLQRLLNVTVQRLLLQHPEAPPLQPRDDSQPSESEFRGSMDLLPQIKEEPKLQTVQTEEEARNSEEGNRSCLEPLQDSHPDRTVSITPSLPLMSREVKTEADRHEGDGQQLVDILPSSTTVSSHMQKSRKPHRTEQQFRGSLRSNGKHNVHLLQMKNARTLKPVSPRPSPPSPGIQRWHSCKECGKGFSFACQLEVHMRWHTKEKPYSCTVCRKSFTTVSMLKRHHRIHTGEKPFRCHVCGKCFNQSAHLNTHFRLHTRERASWSRTTGPSKT